MQQYHINDSIMHVMITLAFELLIERYTYIAFNYHLPHDNVNMTSCLDATSIAADSGHTTDCWHLRILQRTLLNLMFHAMQETGLQTSASSWATRAFLRCTARSMFKHAE